MSWDSVLFVCSKKISEHKKQLCTAVRSSNRRGMYNIDKLDVYIFFFFFSKYLFMTVYAPKMALSFPMGSSRYGLCSAEPMTALHNVTSCYHILNVK